MTHRKAEDTVTIEVTLEWLAAIQRAVMPDPIQPGRWIRVGYVEPMVQGPAQARLMFVSTECGDYAIPSSVGASFFSDN